MAAVLLASLALLADAPARVTVRLDQPGARVSPTLWGIFFEEINHAGDGGLYAELIRNRSFEEVLPPEGTTLLDGRCVAPGSPNYMTGQLRRWSVPWPHESEWPGWTLEVREARASLSLRGDDPAHPANARYLRLTVDALPAAGHVSLRNEGYWGVPARAGDRYDLSLFARCPAPMSLRVGLVAADGRVLTEARLDGVGPAWARHTAVLTPTASDPQATFFLAPLGAGTVDLDVVSLLPRRQFGRPGNGIRRDLGELLAGLRPAFVRFPGGCVVEGATLANRYRWKETIGPFESRPGHWSLWGYRNTDGLGYHEFLQLCEDLDAEGMFVINCGLSCEYRNGDFADEAQVQELIQEALDGIEYALGDTATRWGAERARNGHPAPFPLRWVEIGNENHGPRYEALYRRFAAAIAAAWPQVELISNVHLPEATLEDQHFYVAPDWFFANAGRYDAAPRRTPRIYVGEYACNQGVGSGNLLAALSEACFMLGIERNSDQVVMASYAPLFYNVRDLNWPVNLIGYDNRVSFGRTSYWVQRLFAEHRPEQMVGCEVASPTAAPTAEPGRVGVGTWDTQAEFRNLRVSHAGQTLHAADFAPGTPGWSLGEGDWSVVDGVLRQSGGQRPATALLERPRWSEYTLELEARKLGGSEGFLIPFSDSGRGKSWWNLGGWGNREHGLEVPGITAPHVPGSIETGRWYAIRIEVGAARVRCYLDGELIQEAERRALPTVWATAGRADGEVIVKLVNLAGLATAVELALPGVRLEPVGRSWSLSAAALTEENSLSEPRRIVPVEAAVGGVGDRFAVRLAPHSLTVLRLAEERPRIRRR